MIFYVVCCLPMLLRYLYCVSIYFDLVSLSNTGEL